MHVLFRIDGGLGFDTGIGKKLLRFFARVSALAVVVPINFFRHRQFLRFTEDVYGCLY